MAEASSHSIFQGNFISSDPETRGFDRSSGSTWIYPENYPRREYQFNIVQTALYNNTLVCLPTGLGKTFIAAVTMYNFWRWYPRGKVVFLAPTKPLVAQQINACHEIMGIPSDQTIELTGAINKTKRAVAWAQYRVIFATPQTFQKDLQNGYVPCELIKCIVIDEAHKALGHHSYCEIVRMVNEKNKFFRILALSATPGSKIDSVREVIQNLLISELELRDDTSPDITPYTNNRSMERIIVKLDKTLNDYKDRYIGIMDPHVRILIKNHILQGNAANISKGRIFMLIKQYESRPNKPQNHGTIMKTLNILMTMYHAYELLLKNGLRAFHHFYQNHSDKFWLDAEVELKLMLEDIKMHIGDFPVIQPADEGTIPDIPDNLVFGHTKFIELQNLLVNHFKSFSLQNQSTRAIVFVEYRDIVNEVYVLLLQNRPLIRPQMFVGQAGQKQRVQLAALEDFRNNKVNVLISTSVGEEGLDVGEVDLIVCFDISTSTPTRLVQRMGRTGRKRNGRVVLLLTEGKEVQTLNEAMSKKNSLNSKVLQSSNIASSLYQSSPRMIPENITPECLAMFIKALPKTPKVSRGKKVPAQKVTKPPAEPKPRKRKKDAAFPENDDNFCVPSTSKSPFKPSQSKFTNNNNQSSMIKFLTDQRQPKKSVFSHDVDSGYSEDFQQPENRENPYSYIPPYEVKLLTSDSHALDFLTLCAMKKSEESSTDNILELNMKWVPPPRSSTLTDDIFRNLKLPPLESLECIKHLKMSETPAIKNAGDSFFPDRSQVSRMCNSQSNAYEDFSRKDDGMYDNFYDITSSRHSITTQKNDPVENLDDFASDFFGTFNGDKRQSIVVSKQPSEDNLDEMEISAADFFCTFTEDKAVNSTIKQPDDCSKKESQPLSNITPANVEVDFENLLDEDTESEASESPSLLVEDANIFDDLLEGGSSTEEDLFAEQNTIVSTDLNDEQKTIVSADFEEQNTIVSTDPDKTIRAKRSASVSPKRNSPPKKRKLSYVISDSSDNESTVMATPPKPTKSLLRDMVSPVKEVIEVDSEEDMFDGLDFDETQFDAGNQEDNELDSEMNTSPVLTRREPSFRQNFPKKTSATLSIEDQNKSSDRDGMERTIQQIKSPSLNAESAKESSAFEELDAEADRRADCLPSASLRKNDSVVEEVSKKKTTAAETPTIIELNDNDWLDDDFDLAPLTKEKVSGFFQSSTSTGWITAGQSQTKKKGLSVKNWCAQSERSQESTKISRPAARPKLQLSNLKAAATKSKDQDGFAMPVAPRLPDKENQLLVWRERLNASKSNGDVSPRFRKYRSESDLCSSIEKVRNKEKRCRRRLQRPKARKRIASGFIEDEAEVSSDCNTSEGSSADEKDLAEMDSFVSYTQDVTDTVDMRAHYLQTLKNSPIRHGAFMIKQVQKKIPDIEIFSQPVSREEKEESYLYDSFCVGDETQAHACASDPEESILEKIESSLESRRRKMREQRERKRSKFQCLQKNRKDSKSEANSTSSDDETEALRRQILEESVMFKR